MDESFGIVPLQRRADGWFACVVLQKNGNFWGFPKGHAEEGESHQITAERELAEEIGLRVVKYLPFAPLHEEYTFERAGQKIDKRVTFFLAEVSGSLVLQAGEIQSAEWLPLKEAEDQMTYPEGQELCQKVTKLLHALPGEIT